ncbi:predicted protein [Histoplasma capsulatum var. duboisii H88]|uniref:Predicted protein n=1 Tax=Ajellomyces capsulatus (strain H88) TaxID=544711 RepID=F0U8I7_AJEC8|nr:predicted protein [Histoplasma capsulatum var. duboisii H88]
MISRGSEEKIKEEILESLYHPNMHYQREWISSAHKKTFNWTRRIKPGRHIRWDNLKHWLSSTFLESGNINAKVTTGVVAELTPQNSVAVTESHPESPSGSGPTLHYSTHRKKPSLRLKFCFLIDALDEFDGDHQSLVDLLVGCAPGVSEATPSSKHTLGVSLIPYLINRHRSIRAVLVYLQTLSPYELTLKEGRNVLIYTIADAAVPAAERTANRFQVELNLH